MKSGKLVTLLLVFIVLMFTITGTVISKAINALNTTEKDKTLKNVFIDTRLKNMTLLNTSPLKSIDNFFNILKNDSKCVYNSSFIFQKELVNPNLNLLTQNFNLLLGFLENYNTYVASNAYKGEIKKFEEPFAIYGKDFELIRFKLIVTAHKKYCLPINTALYCQTFFEFKENLQEQLFNINNILNANCKKISNYFPFWFETEMIRIIALPFEFNYTCTEYQNTTIQEMMKNISRVLKNIDITDDSDQLRKIIWHNATLDCKKFKKPKEIKESRKNAVRSINESNTICVYSTSLVVILLARSFSK